MATITKRTLNIQDLLDNGEQPWGPLPQDTFDAIAEGIISAKGHKLLVPVIVSTRYRLLDGHNRLLILKGLDRKQIDSTEFRIDESATDSESEAIAAIGWQRNRRQTGTAESAAVARDLMRRFSWSQGIVAQRMGVSAAAVSQWLKAHPDPTFEVTERRGLDGKTYSVEAEEEEEIEPPKPKRIRTKQKGGAAVETTVNRYVAELTDPSLGEWIVDNADAEDRESLALRLDGIGTAMGAIADRLRALATPDEGGEF